MSRLVPVLVVCAWAGDPPDLVAIRKAIATFSNPRERSTVVAPDARIAPLLRQAGSGISPAYLEVKAIRLVSPDVAVVDGTASQFGSLILKRSMPVVFVLQREDGIWRISELRIVRMCEKDHKMPGRL